MPIQEPDPFSRNLNLASVVVIAFYWGGGQFDSDGPIRIPFLPTLTFSNGDFLLLLGWGVYFWFLFRYWQAHGYKPGGEFKGELHEFRTRPGVDKKVVNWLVKMQFLPYGKQPSSKGRVISAPETSIDAIRYTLTNKWTFNPDEVVQLQQQGHVTRSRDGWVNMERKQITPRAFQLFRLRIYSAVYVALTRPGFMSQYFSYLLVVWALWVPAGNSIAKLFS